MCDASLDLFKVWKISDNYYHLVNYERQRHICNTNRKSCVAYRKALLPMSLHDLEGHFCSFLTHIPRETWHNFTNIACHAVPLQ